MLISNLVRHLRQRDWLAVVLDFAVVALGILLALQVDAWDQNRQDRNREQQLIQRLQDDFTYLKRRIELETSQLEIALKAQSQLEKYLTQIREGVALSEVGNLKQIILESTIGRAPLGRSATYLEMLSSGELSLIKNDELRNSLSAYDARVQSGEVLWLSLRQEKTQFTPAVLEHLQLKVGKYGSYEEIVQSYDLEGMAHSTEFATALQVYASIENNNLEIFNSLGRLIDSVLIQLKAQ